MKKLTKDQMKKVEGGGGVAIQKGGAAYAKSIAGTMPALSSVLTYIFSS